MTDPRISVVEHEVFITVSEPWELAPQDPSDRLRGTIAAVQRLSDRVQFERIIVDLATPIVWRGMGYGSLLLEARHGGGLADLLSGGGVECNFIGITATERAQPTELDLASWRGGLAGISTLRLASG